MSKFSSFKEHQLITESWRRFLKEGLYDTDPASQTLKTNLNKLWGDLNKASTISKFMTDEELAASAFTADELADAAGIEVGDLVGLAEVPGINWDQTGESEFTPKHPKEVAVARAELGARERTAGARPGEQIGPPGSEQEQE